ncbi:MAG: TrmH family RNA methyltransferase [Rhodospirillaceae bacterium]
MPQIVSVSDPADPRIEGFRDVRERDLVGRAGMFVAEGEVVLKTLAEGRSPHRLRSLLIAEKRIPGLMPLLEKLPEEVPVYAAAQAVMDAVAGFSIHRGILGLGVRAPEPGLDAALAALPARATVAVFSAIANHDNIGGLFRNAAAFGVDLAVLDSDCCDPLYRKAIRVSVGAALTVPTARGGRIADILEALAAAGFDLLGLSPRGETALADYARGARAAAVFGAEGPGLSEAVLARTVRLRIPMAAGFDSLNVATAAGIVLHHLMR